MTHLVLRSPDQLGRAYLMSPLAGILTLWLCFAVALGTHFGAALLVIPLFFIFGSMYCLLVLFLVVMPLVAGLRRYDWRWVNIGSIAVIGFLSGALPITLLTVALSGQLVASLTELAPFAGALGIAGIAAAITFMRIAMTPADIGALEVRHAG